MASPFKCSTGTVPEPTAVATVGRAANASACRTSRLAALWPVRDIAARAASSEPTPGRRHAPESRSAMSSCPRTVARTPSSTSSRPRTRARSTQCRESGARLRPRARAPLRPRRRRDRRGRALERPRRPRWPATRRRTELSTEAWARPRRPGTPVAWGDPGHPRALDPSPRLLRTYVRAYDRRNRRSPAVRCGRTPALAREAARMPTLCAEPGRIWLGSRRLAWAAVRRRDVRPTCNRPHPSTAPGAPCPPPGASSSSSQSPRRRPRRLRHAEQPPSRCGHDLEHDLHARAPRQLRHDGHHRQAADQGGHHQVDQHRDAARARAAGHDGGHRVLRRSRARAVPGRLRQDPRRSPTRSPARRRCSRSSPTSSTAAGSPTSRPTVSATGPPCRASASAPTSPRLRARRRTTSPTR